MLMPMGKFKGQPVEAMTTAYLHWLVCNDAIRFKRWPLVEEALRILRSRFEDFDALLAGLKVDRPPPRRWDTPERTEQRAKEKAEKLHQLEERRAEERKRRREERSAQRILMQMQAQAEVIRQRREASLPPSSEPPPGVWRDASYFVRQSREAAVDPNDASDLV
ncbi:hypothetical protein GPA27_19445 [Aromatoleum toluolicum]|uniref:Uncharacterized protein n=1 Tax=Aromatoleum toluolicum TaxID=90060 RepID=A0ABX1NJQ5_9RHOO|nr:hypothetical protein [Aromatoleum toluolicum]NMF99556.1 hypothetical protein [Aromatoleum toluolicum]